MRFSVVYSFIDNDTRHHSGQNLVDSRGAAILITVMTRIVVDKTIYHAKPHSIRKNAWEKSNDAYSLSIRVHTTKNHTSIYFLPQYQRQRKIFFQSASWKRHCVTHWRKHCGRDSYLPRQITQSDCQISSNCGKKVNCLSTNRSAQKLWHQARAVLIAMQLNVYLLL